MKLPGPDHPITIERNGNRVRVNFGNMLIAETTDALTLCEAGYAPVQYIPRGDVAMALLERTDHRTTCPYKGEASHFSISAGGKQAVNAVWSYEEPYPAVAEIKERLAFYPHRVDKIEETAA